MRPARSEQGWRAEAFPARRGGQCPERARLLREQEVRWGVLAKRKTQMATERYSTLPVINEIHSETALRCRSTPSVCQTETLRLPAAGEGVGRRGLSGGAGVCAPAPSQVQMPRVPGKGTWRRFHTDVHGSLVRGSRSGLLTQ